MLLPTLVAYELFPDLAPAAKATITKARMVRAAPMIFVLGLIQLYGQLAIVAVATDHGRSTVGAALRRAFIALPRVIVAALALILAAIVLIVVVSVIGGVLVSLVAPASALTDKRTAVAISAVVMIPFAWAALRLSLFTTIAVAEDKGPLVAIRESWRTTKGHAAAIAVLFLFGFIGAIAVQGLVGLVADGSGNAVDAMLGGHFGRFIASVVGGAIGALANLYLTMMVVSVWRRLREPGHTLHAHPAD